MNTHNLFQAVHELPLKLGSLTDSTICARDNRRSGNRQYRGASSPPLYNELLHRVTGAVVDHVLGREGDPSFHPRNDPGSHGITVSRSR